jgi:type II secretory pathway pseudopilin PulG
MRANSKKSGFSLVEVVLALGIASFALMAVVGLLPVGMKSAQDAREKAAASLIVHSIANVLRNAERVPSGSYSNSFAGRAVSFTVGGASSIISWDDLDFYGNRATNSLSARFKARLVITPPASSNTTGSAIVSVAWPALSPALAWSGTNWLNAQGVLCTGLQFLPNP